MRKLILYLFFLLIPLVNRADISGFDEVKTPGTDLYTGICLSEAGLSKNIFELALKGLKKLELLGKLHNPDIVTIADYSQSSSHKRLYVIDLKNRKLLFNTYVAHGRKSGDEFALNFSNVEGSHKSSLGFYITEQTVYGPHTGFSLLIEGVEKGINDNAIKREIIIHAAEYASEGFITKNGHLGRSFGCPALPPEMNKPIIETIKGGTCLFLYNPDNHYLTTSSFLN